MYVPIMLLFGATIVLIAGRVRQVSARPADRAVPYVATVALAVLVSTNCKVTSKRTFDPGWRHHLASESPGQCRGEARTARIHGGPHIATIPCNRFREAAASWMARPVTPG